MAPSKIEREIEEILRSSEAPTQQPGGKPPRDRGIRISPESLMAAGLVVLIAAIVVKGLAVLFVVAAVVLFATGYTGYLKRGRSARVQNWRGRPTDRSGNVIRFGDRWASRIRRWFGGR